MCKANQKKEDDVTVKKKLEIKNNVCKEGKPKVATYPASTCNEDLFYRLSLNVESRVGIDEFVEHMKETDIGPVGACAICGKNYVYGGFNPHLIIWIAKQSTILSM
jgi:hypothetical protein